MADRRIIIRGPSVRSIFDTGRPLRRARPTGPNPWRFDGAPGPVPEMPMRVPSNAWCLIILQTVYGMIVVVAVIVAVMAQAWLALAIVVGSNVAFSEGFFHSWLVSARWIAWWRRDKHFNAMLEDDPAYKARYIAHLRDYAHHTGFTND